MAAPINVLAGVFTAISLPGNKYILAFKLHVNCIEQLIESAPVCSSDHEQHVVTTRVTIYSGKPETPRSKIIF